MEKLYQQAKIKGKDWIDLRRALHANAEVGFDLPKTREIVCEKLSALGYAPEKIGKGGILAKIGEGEKCFLLRADMDGLPIKEKTGVKYACKRGNMHACGHDMHTAMLLGAAELLKTNEKRLKSKILLLFQPAEELLQGANDCIQTGFLQREKVQGAASLHVMTDVPFPCGTILLPNAGVSAPAADFFRIQIRGKACHGAAPQNGVDALLVGAQTVAALQVLSARESAAAVPIVLTVGQMRAGSAANVLADSCELLGTMRTFDENVRAYAKKRIREIAEGTAKSMRAKAKVEFTGGAPTLTNDKEILEGAKTQFTAVFGKEKVFAATADGGVVAKNGGSEDFAYFSQAVPSLMFAIAAGRTEEGFTRPLHHAQVDFDEGAIAYGAAALCALALSF